MESILGHYNNKVVAAYTLDLLYKNQQGTNGDKKMGVVKHLVRKIELQVRERQGNLNPTQKIDSKRSKIPIPKKKVPQSKSIPAVTTQHTNQGGVKPRSTNSSGSTFVKPEAQNTVRKISQGCRTMIKTGPVAQKVSRKDNLNQNERTSKPFSTSTTVRQKVSKGKSSSKEEAPVGLPFTPRLHRASTPDLDKMLTRSRQGTNSSNVFQRLYSQRKQYSPRESPPVVKLVRSKTSLGTTERGINASKWAGCNKDYGNICISRGSENRNRVTVETDVMSEGFRQAIKNMKLSDGD